jgi:REP element-mobilizing transposase RayT
MSIYTDAFEPGFTYHVYNRAVGSEKLFFEDRNYFYFLEKLYKNTVACMDIWAYCLLGNHFHLLMTVKDTSKTKDVSEAFRRFGISYSQAINKQEGRMGSLFMKPIKRVRITGERHLKNLIVYIHTNPYLHGISRDYRNYRWSSYQDFVGKRSAIVAKDSLAWKDSTWKDSITPSDGFLKPDGFLNPSEGVFSHNKILTKYFNDIDNFKYVHQKRAGFNDISGLIIED